MTNIANIPRTIAPPSLLSENGDPSGLKQLEVNVIFTGTNATALALETASQLAAGLNARIRIRAAFAVPMRLPLDHPQVSIAFMEKLLSDLAAQLPEDAPEATGHVYLCRDRLETFSRVLFPNSLVVVAGPKRLWRTGETRIARRLQSDGHRVIFVPTNGRTIIPQHTETMMRTMVRADAAGTVVKFPCGQEQS